MSLFCLSVEGMNITAELFKMLNKFYSANAVTEVQWIERHFKNHTEANNVLSVLKKSLGFNECSLTNSNTTIKCSAN